MSVSHFSFIDLFSGCGGLSLGLMNAGWEGAFAIEVNPDAFKTLSYNLIDRDEHNSGNPLFSWPNWLEKKPHDITEFVKKYRRQLIESRGKVQLVAGGSPCQGFSFAGRRTEKDPRNELFKYHLEVVSILHPELVLMENVQGISTAFGSSQKLRKNKKGSPSKSYANRICESLEKQGYKVQQHVLKAAEFGVPQLRQRYFTLGIRNDLLYGIDEPNLQIILNNIRDFFLSYRGLPVLHPVTVSDAISDLKIDGKELVECTDEESPLGFKEILYQGPETTYQKLMQKGMNGRSPNSLRLVNHRHETVQRYEDILSTCRKGVNLSGEDRLRLGINKTSITPLAADKPSHTLTTLPDDLLHYAEPRIHTVREYARLQSFPDQFVFRGKFTTGGNRRVKECPRYTQVGNAVPPLLAEAIGESLLIILDELKSKQSTSQRIDFLLKAKSFRCKEVQ